MSELTEPQAGLAPKALRTARVILYIQAIASLLLVVVEMVAVNELAQHGEQVPGLAYYAVVVDPLVAVAILTSAILVVSHRTWVRPVAVVAEVVGIANDLINISSGYFQAVVAICLAITVIVLLYRPEADDWIAGRTPLDG